MIGGRLGIATPPGHLDGHRTLDFQAGFWATRAQVAKRVDQ